MADDTATIQVHAPPTDTDKKESFSREYVHELREENKNWRLKAQELQKSREEIQMATEKELKVASEKISATQQVANGRIIRAELKAHAIGAGMIDLDGLKLADLSKVTLSEEGDVSGAEELMAALKEAKPYLFKEFQSTSSTSATPPKKPDTPKLARDMSDAEYEKAKARLTSR